MAMSDQSATIDIMAESENVTPKNRRDAPDGSMTESYGIRK